jgi:hypothetical protein
VPERTVIDLNQAVLKFAAGDDQTREQMSSTWFVRVTRGIELFVLNREAGGNRAHISVHQDGRCHYKIGGPSGRGQKHTEWDLQEPMDATGVRRLATVAIPHRGLHLPDNFAGTDPETVLIPPPPEGCQLEVDILVEPGNAPDDQWPGQTALNAALVGRFTLYTGSPDEGLLHFTVVSTVRPESAAARLMSEATITVVDGAEPPVSPRSVIFELVEVDNQKLPVLTEMPVGHLRSNVETSEGPSLPSA